MKITRDTQGFSLLEIIVALPLLAIAAAMIMTYLQGTAPQSAQAMNRFKDRNQLQTTMEAINHAYRQGLKTQDFSLAAFLDEILTTYPLVNAQDTQLLKLQPDDPTMLLVTLEKEGQRLSILFSQ